MRTMFRLLSVFSALALALLVVEGDAWAQGKRARSGNSSKQVTRTGPQGGQQTWSQNRSWKRGGGSFESRRERTGPAGRTRSKDVEAVRTGDGYRKSTTWTDAQGRQATRDAEVVVDREAGTRDREVQWVGRDGAMRTRSDATRRTEDGYTRSSTFTGAEGRQATRDATVSVDRDAGSAGKTVEWVGPEGSTASRNTEVLRTDSGREAVTTVTRPDGSVVTYEKSVERELED